MIIPLNFPTFTFFRAQPTNQAIWCYMICPWPLEGVPCAMTTGLNQCAGASRYAASAQRGLPAIGGRQEKAGNGMVGSWKFWDILKWKELHLRSQFHRVFTLLHFFALWIILDCFGTSSIYPFDACLYFSMLSRSFAILVGLSTHFISQFISPVLDLNSRAPCFKT